MTHAGWRLRTPLGWALAIGFGALASYVDLHNTDVQMPAMLLIVFSALLGFLHPRHAWQWALLIGLSIPVGYAIATANGYHVPYPAPSSRASIVFLPLAFAIAGAYGGAWLRGVTAGQG